MGGEKIKRIAEIFDLFQADHATEFAFALTAAAHVETQCDVAEIVEHAGWLQHIGAVGIRAEAVQDEERGATFGRVQILGHAEHAMQT